MNRKTSLLSVHLGPLKQDWVDYCRARGVSPSDATRQVIRKLVGREAQSATVQNVDTLDPLEEKVRVEIRITATERRAVLAIAEAAGFSVNLWIVALIRARLTGSPQFGQGELEQLASSNSRLLAIGRNLNQIARVLNAAPTEVARVPFEAVEALSREIKSHTVAVGALIQSNVQRWSR